MHQSSKFILFWNDTLHAVKQALLYIQSWTADDGRKDRPKHVECDSKTNLIHWCVWLVSLQKLHFPYHMTIFKIYPRSSSHLYILSHLLGSISVSNGKCIHRFFFLWLEIVCLKHVPFDINILSSPSFTVCSTSVAQSSNMLDWVCWTLYC